MSLITSVQTGGVNSHPTTSEEINAVITDFASEGVVGTLVNTSGVAPMTGGFAVNAQGTPDATVAVSAGVAYVTGTPTSQSSQTFRVKNTATENVTITANSSGSTKYDWVYIKLDPTNLNAPNTAGDNAATLVTSRSSSSTADDGTPPTYGYNIAVVTVANGFSTITNGNIRDTRQQTGMTTTTAASSTASWSSLGATPSSVVYNGNRSYTLTFTGTDLTDDISPGMRLRTSRTVAAPTQCTDLESGSSQYYSKTTPAGMTFTDDFVVSAWVKLESYPGTNMALASRYNGTSGWIAKITSSGQVLMQGNNAGSPNFSYVQSYQSLPLGKWVHIAVQLDMSAFTATTTTSYVMFDGLDVPASVARGGTNPTALVQAGDLQIGADNATEFFDGKIAQVAIYSAKVTQATMRGYISQGLAGTETSLISAYSFNNSIADLNTTNANNLTANGSAVATNADSPFGGQGSGLISSTMDYGIVMSADFVTDTTMVVQAAGGCTVPTSGGVSASSYATNKAPYQFPTQREKWQILGMFKVLAQHTAPVAGTWYNDAAGNLTIPVGSWRVFYQAQSYGYKNGGAVFGSLVTLSTANNSESDKEFSTFTNVQAGAGLVAASGHVFREKPLTLAVATPYYLNYKTDVASADTVGIDGSGGPAMVVAECAHL